MLFKYPNYIYRSNYLHSKINKNTNKINKINIINTFMLMSLSPLFYEFILIYRDWFNSLGYWEEIVN
jgi:hypothetical protein